MFRNNINCPMCGEGMEQVDDNEKIVDGEWRELGWYQCDKCKVGVLGERFWSIIRVWTFTDNEEESDGFDPYDLIKEKKREAL